MTDYTWPDDLAPFAVSFYLQAHTGGSESPFTRQTKVYGLSAPRWVCSMSFRGGYDGIGHLTNVGPRLDALIAKLQGRLNRAAIYDFRRSAPRTKAWPAAATNLAATKGAIQMTVTGLLPGMKAHAGDYIGGDGRPHIITDDAIADGSGHAVVSFEPALSADVGAGAALLSKVTGRFRLTDDDAGQNGVVVGDPINMTLNFVEDLA
jgi:hypothetical protein